MASPPDNEFEEPGLPSSRCVVARGRAGRVEMCFEGPDPTTCRVGAARNNDWWIEGRGTPAQALDLHWDGSLLWAADRAGNGRVTVDGEPLRRRWRGLAGECRIEFPGGALVIKCSRPGVVVEEHPRGLIADPAPVMSEVREVLRPPAESALESLPTLDESELVDEPTRSWQSESSVSGATIPMGRPGRQAMLPPPMPYVPGAARATLPGVGRAIGSAAASGAVERERTTPIFDEATPTSPGRISRTSYS